VLRQAACDGAGVTLPPEWQLEADLAAERPRPCLARHAAHPIGYDAEILVVWRRDALVPAQVPAFVSDLVGCLQGGR
jgi:DNA-binding transcriptional LysR family regulator